MTNNSLLGFVTTAFAACDASVGAVVLAKKRSKKDVWPAAPKRRGEGTRPRRRDAASALATSSSATVGSTW